MPAARSGSSISTICCGPAPPDSGVRCGGGTVAPALRRHRGLVFPLAPPADGARGARRGLRGPCRDARVADGAKAIEAEGFVAASGAVRARQAVAVRRARHRSAHCARCTGASSPDIAHHVSLQSSVLGSLAALGRPAGCINALTGLGYAYTSGGAKALLPASGAERAASHPAQPAAPDRAGAKSGRPRRHAFARHRRRTHRAHSGLRRRHRARSSRARAARRAGHRGLRRAAPRRQGHPHPRRAHSACCVSAARRRAADRRHARPGQSGIA